VGVDFHSACARILRREAAHLGMRSTFSIYDQSDAVRLTGYILRDLNLDPKRLPPRRSTPPSRRPRTS
jgi:Superfamily I DNA and RNA helicases